MTLIKDIWGLHRDEDIIRGCLGFFSPSSVGRTVLRNVNIQPLQHTAPQYRIPCNLTQDSVQLWALVLSVFEPWGSLTIVLFSYIQRKTQSPLLHFPSECKDQENLLLHFSIRTANSNSKEFSSYLIRSSYSSHNFSPRQHLGREGGKKILFCVKLVMNFFTKNVQELCKTRM